MNVFERIVKLEKIVERLLARTSIYYAKNTFTPTYTGATTAGTTTYTTQVGAYTRIGRVVIATLNLTWTAATGTGAVRIGGLPFTSDGTTSLLYSFQPRTNNVTFANGSIDGVLQNNQTVAQLFSPITNGASTELAIEAAGTITATIIYFTS